MQRGMLRQRVVVQSKAAFNKMGVKSSIWEMIEDWEWRQYNNSM
jgi:hypothetical protein